MMLLFFLFVFFFRYSMLTQNAKDRALFRKIKFQYLIMDEAHMMKNMNTERYKNINKIEVSYFCCCVWDQKKKNLESLELVLLRTCNFFLCEIKILIWFLYIKQCRNVKVITFPC